MQIRPINAHRQCDREHLTAQMGREVAVESGRPRWQLMIVPTECLDALLMSHDFITCILIRIDFSFDNRCRCGARVVYNS